MNEPTIIELTHKRWEHNILSVANQGDIPRFDLLQREYGKWCLKNNTEEREINLFDLDVDQIQTKVAQTVEKPKEIGKNKKEVNTNMIVGEQVGNYMTSLSPYWNDVMINKNVHMPVSIFDPKWLLQDATYVKRKTRNTTCQADTPVYPGSPVLNEYRLTFAEWMVRFNLMIKYQEMKYDVLEDQRNSPIAPRLIAHRDNCLQIQIDCWGKWPTAMRYDIAHRRNIWENRLTNGGMADVGTIDKNLLEQAERDAKHFSDYNYVDNPYAFGGPMQNISPIDGNVYPENNSWDTAGALVDTHADMITGRNLPVWNNHQPTERSNTSGVIRKPKGYHSQGQNFDPNYHKKQFYHQRQNNNHNPVNQTYQNNHQTYPNNSYRGYQNTYNGGGHFQGNYNGNGRGGYRTYHNDRPAIGPGSFKVVEGTQPGNQNRNVEPIVPVASGSK
ncbi:hypothetical protein DFH28DRAFT_1187437 [Melampsora americana]|nr:hypothetical protein DFH28DRAFT_1187437 [Melampsora americana]